MRIFLFVFVFLFVIVYVCSARLCTSCACMRTYVCPYVCPCIGVLRPEIVVQGCRRPSRRRPHRRRRRYYGDQPKTHYRQQSRKRE